MPKAYLDSCMIIGLIEGDTTQQHLLRKQLVSYWVYSSELARMETRLLAIRNKNQKNLKHFDIFFASCEMISLDKAVFEHATLLRAQSALKTPDALHLAAAIQAGCDEFWTDDKQLRSIATHHIKVVDWEALVSMP